MSRRGKGRKREACSRGGKGRVPGGREGCGQVVREGWRERGTGVPPGFSSVAGRARGEGGQSASSFLGGTRAGRDASAGWAAGKERAETRRAAGPDDARKGRDEGSGKGVSWACPGPPRERDRPPYLKGQHGTPPDGGMPLTGLPLPLNARPDAGTHAFSSCPPPDVPGAGVGGAPAACAGIRARLSPQARASFPAPFATGRHRAWSALLLDFAPIAADTEISGLQCGQAFTTHVCRGFPWMRLCRLRSFHGKSAKRRHHHLQNPAAQRL